eukprot:m.733252 g.733252  ORF g.733252 m.733252 type:complete len:66 (-) comp23070_c0_seq9:2860-3057(-)
MFAFIILRSIGHALNRFVKLEMLRNLAPVSKCIFFAVQDRSIPSPDCATERKAETPQKEQHINAF